MLIAVADTHAIIWYLYNDSRLSSKALTLFENAVDRGEQIAFSSISIAEIIYLVEKRRIATDAIDRFLNAIDSENAVLMEVPFDRYIAQTMQEIERSQIPDLPDRIIAATALYLNLPLISRDGKIMLSKIDTVW